VNIDFISPIPLPTPPLFPAPNRAENAATISQVISCLPNIPLPYIETPVMMNIAQLTPTPFPALTQSLHPADVGAMTVEADTGAERIATGPGHVTAVPGKIIQGKIGYLRYLVLIWYLPYFWSVAYLKWLISDPDPTQEIIPDPTQNATKSLAVYIPYPTQNATKDWTVFIPDPTHNATKNCTVFIPDPTQNATKNWTDFIPDLTQNATKNWTVFIPDPTQNATKVWKVSF
jgi:hypothetical protein